MLIYCTAGFKKHHVNWGTTLKMFSTDFFPALFWRVRAIISTTYALITCKTFFHATLTMKSDPPIFVMHFEAFVEITRFRN